MKGHSDITFAWRLRQLRLQAWLTQQQLADQMTAAGHRMNRTAISKIESGDRLVTIGEAVQLAAALRVPLQALLTADLPHDLIEARLVLPPMRLLPTRPALHLSLAGTPGGAAIRYTAGRLRASTGQGPKCRPL
jgi:transcriptional regulator with XRE-family HTH domain